MTRSASRPLFDDEHDQFRDSFRRFVAERMTAQHESWSADGVMPRSVFELAGEHGFLAMAIPEEFGGGGVSDFRFNVVVNEELQAGDVTAAGLGITLHNDICLPYFLEYSNDEQKRRWLPGIASGSLITAVAMTEPHAGSDLAALSTTARRDGDSYVLSGSKTFITNGINADLVIVAAKTEPDRGRDGVTLIVVDGSTPGFTRGRNLDKVGMHAQDTAELFFDDAVVPAANVLGEPGQGFRYLMTNLAQERLSIAVAAVAAARRALDITVEYVSERTAFGRPVGSFQYNKFQIAQLSTDVEVGQAFVDQCVLALNERTLTGADAARAKLWATEMQGRVVDRCVQLHGGYGYMSEYPIARAYTDARITRIYGGTSEIMMEIISRDLGLS